MKLLLVGPNKVGKTNLLSLMRQLPRPQETGLVNVQSFHLEGQRITVFEVSQSSLISNQSNGTDGIILLIDPKDKTKLYAGVEVLGSIASESQLDNVPIVIAVRTVEGSGAVREVQAMMDLHRLRDREFIFKEIAIDSKKDAVDCFTWIARKKRQRDRPAFDAAPKVVRYKAKYRDGDKARQTFERLMGDAKFKALSTVEQEKQFIRSQQLRQKDQRTEIALADYNKNKKKMLPYQIKPGPNPRIAPNLEFFLTDTKNQRRNEDHKAVMTDDFFELPSEKPFVPKKIGIDRQTQIQDDQLFDFDRQVNPILDTVASKVLEMAILELQQEEQLVRIQQLKSEHQARKGKEKDRAKQLIAEERRLIAVKEQALQKGQKKLIQHQHTYTRLQHYEIAAQCLAGLSKNVIGSLRLQGFYPDEFQNDMQTRYVDFLVEGTTKAIERKLAHATLLDGIFDDQLLKHRFQARQPLFKQRAALSEKAELRRINTGTEQRIICLYYEDQTSRASTYSRNYKRVVDGNVTEFLRNMSERKKILRQQVNTSEITENDFSRIVKEEFEEAPVFSTLVSSSCPYAFTFSYNPFFKDYQPNFQLTAFVIQQNKYQLATSKSAPAWLHFQQHRRDVFKKTDIDEAILINLETVPATVMDIHFYVRVSNLAKLAQSQNKTALYEVGFQNFKYGVQLANLSLKNFNFGEMAIKADEGVEPPVSSCMIFAYRLYRSPQFGGWMFESVGLPSKTMLLDQQQPFLQSVAQQAKALAIGDVQELQEQLQQWMLKQEKQEKQVEQPKKSSRQIGGRTTKTILKKEEKKETKKKLLPCSRVSAMLKVPLAGFAIEQILSKSNDFAQQIPQFLSRCPVGFDVMFKNKPLQTDKQLGRVRRMTDLQLVARPQPEPQPEPQPQQQEQNQVEANE